MKKYIDLVVVRHDNTSISNRGELEVGNAHLSEEDFWQVKDAAEKLADMAFNYIAAGATLRMMETLEEIKKTIKIETEECDTRLDSRTNSNGPTNLWPGEHDDLFLGPDGYHDRAQKILRVLAARKLPNGGKALLVTTAGIIAPLYVLANGINPVSEDHYSGAVYGRFSPQPASIHCFRYFLETGEFQVVTLNEVKNS